VSGAVVGVKTRGGGWLGEVEQSWFQEVGRWEEAGGNSHGSRRWNRHASVARLVSGHLCDG